MESFLQSREWMELQKYLGRETLSLEESAFKSFFIRYTLPFHFDYWYAPHGPIFKNIAPQNIQSFINLAKKHLIRTKTLFVRIEPYVEYSDEMRNVLKSAGFKNIFSTQPESTIILDLRGDESALLKNMEHDTRYAIRVAERRGVTIERIRGDQKEKTFPVFWEFFAETNKRHNLRMYPKKYYEACAGLEGECRTEFFIAWHEGSPIAGAMVIFYKDTATYLFAGSREGFGKLNAPTLILWKIMQIAKGEGYRFLDLWGISDEKKAWRGVTAFKRSFGGREVRFLGTWDYVVNPFWYTLYSIMKRARQMI